MTDEKYAKYVQACDDTFCKILGHFVVIKTKFHIAWHRQHFQRADARHLKAKKHNLILICLFMITIVLGLVVLPSKWYFGWDSDKNW